MTMMSSQLAHREYANRPADERFESVDALVANALQEREHSKERNYNLRDLRISADAQTLQLVSPKGAAHFSHWGFGQFCRMVGAPSAYLRELPPAIAADALNYGISAAPTGAQATVLVRMPNGAPTPIVRAMTSDSYARIWDSELYPSVQRTIVEPDPRWQLPMTWEGTRAGAYRGDRDSFLILVNGGSIVEDPSLRNANPNASPRATAAGGPRDGSAMYRGILIRNSEVGAAAITIETILFRFICGNHLLWGAVMDRQFRRRHVGARVLRDTMREIFTFARSFSARPESADQAILQQLITRELAHTRDAVIDELRKLGATKEQAEAAYATAERTERVSPRSYWGAAQGLTRVAQETTYQDDRFVLDQLAAKVLTRGARLVAA